MSKVKWSDHAMARMREQTRYIAEQSGSTEIAWKWATDVFTAAEYSDKKSLNSLLRVFSAVSSTAVYGSHPVISTIRTVQSSSSA